MAVKHAIITMLLWSFAVLGAALSEEPGDALALSTEQLQQFEAAEATLLADFEVSHEFAYTSKKPVIPGFTVMQEQAILNRFGSFFSQKPNKIPYGGTWFPSPFDKEIHFRVCPANMEWKVLYIAINANDEPVHIVQFDDMNQWVIWEKCTVSESPHAFGVGRDEPVLCLPTVRTVPLVVMRIPFKSLDDIAVQHIQIMACTSNIRLDIEGGSPDAGGPSDPVGPDPFDPLPIE